MGLTMGERYTEHVIQTQQIMWPGQIICPDLIYVLFFEDFMNISGLWTSFSEQRAWQEEVRGFLQRHDPQPSLLVAWLLALQEGLGLSCLYVRSALGWTIFLLKLFKMTKHGRWRFHRLTFKASPSNLFKTLALEWIRVPLSLVVTCLVWSLQC